MSTGSRQAVVCFTFVIAKSVNESEYSRFQEGPILGRQGEFSFLTSPDFSRRLSVTFTDFSRLLETNPDFSRLLHETLSDFYRLLPNLSRLFFRTFPDSRISMIKHE